MFVTATTREGTVSMTREHKVFSGNRGNQCVKKFRRDSTPSVREKYRVNTRSKKRVTTRNCREQEQRFPFGQLSVASFAEINECSGTHCRMIVKEERKRERIQFLPDLPASLR